MSNLVSLVIWLKTTQQCVDIFGKYVYTIYGEDTDFVDWLNSYKYLL